MPDIAVRSDFGAPRWQGPWDVDIEHLKLVNAHDGLAIELGLTHFHLEPEVEGRDDRDLFTIYLDADCSGSWDYFVAFNWGQPAGLFTQENDQSPSCEFDVRTEYTRRTLTTTVPHRCWNRPASVRARAELFSTRTEADLSCSASDSTRWTALARPGRNASVTDAAGSPAAGRCGIATRISRGC